MFGQEKQSILCGPRAAALLCSADRAELLGVYHAGAYLCFPDGLLLLTDRSRGLVPFGVSFPGYDALFSALNGKDIPEVWIEAKGQETTLTFGSFRLPLGSLSPDRRICRLACLPRREALLAAAGAVYGCKTTGFAPLAGLLCGGSLPDTAEPHLCRAAELLPRLLHSLCTTDPEELFSLVSSLVGLGFGLTPSGDDLLCGMLYAAHYFSPVIGGLYAMRLGNAVGSASGRTNLISRYYLESAVRGERFDAVADFAEALSAGNAKKTEEALCRLLSVGSSSGADIAVGFLALLSFQG